MSSQIFQKKAEIKTQLEIIYNLAQKQNYKQCFEAWEFFQQEYLKISQKTTLLTILNFYNKDKNQTWQFHNEASLINDKTGLISVKKIGDEIQCLNNSQILAKHLTTLFNTLSNYRPSKSEQEIIKNQLIGKNAGWLEMYSLKLRHYLKNWIWTQGEQKGFKYRGQVADAFLQHVGEYHSQLLSLETKQIQNNNLPSVLQEEKSAKLINRMIEAKNRVGWYTGGDLILTDAAGRVIYNIQLKTSSGSGSAIGNIKTTELSKHINKLLILFNNQAEDRQIAMQFYEMLKTSSVKQQLQSEIEKIPADLIKDLTN